jgi:hypothetical protein
VSNEWFQTINQTKKQQQNTSIFCSVIFFTMSHSFLSPILCKLASEADSAEKVSGINIIWITEWWASSHTSQFTSPVQLSLLFVSD